MNTINLKIEDSIAVITLYRSEAMMEAKEHPDHAEAIDAFLEKRPAKFE